MRQNVTQLMQRIGSSVNQEPTAPQSSSAEFSLWLSYLNRAVQEWSESNDWECLRKNYFPTLTSGATVPLPLDFKKLAGPVLVQAEGDIEGGDSFPDIRLEQKKLYSPTDKYVYIMGDINSGYNMIFHPGTLSSGASIEIPYFSMPTSLATTTDVSVVPDSQFLVDRTIAYIFESRSDSRFQEVEAKARERLLGMIENTNDAKYNSYGNPNPVINTMQIRGFRIGQD